MSDVENGQLSLFDDSKTESDNEAEVESEEKAE